MTEAERMAYNRAAAVCREVVEEFANEYVRRWGGDDAAKAVGWAILQAASELRKVPLSADMTPNVKVTGVPPTAAKEGD